MAVAECDLCGLVTRPIADGHCREPHLCQKRDVAVPEVVDPDDGNPRHGASLRDGRLELRRAEVGEYALIMSRWRHVVDEVPKLVAQELREGNLADRLLRLRVGDEVLSLEMPVGMPDVQRRSHEVDACGSERKQLSRPYARPIENLEGGVEQLVVGLRLGEPQILLLGSDVYAASVLGADARGFLERVGAEAVVSLGVVHDGGEGAVDRADVCLRVGLAVLLSESEDLVLPIDDVEQGYVPHALGAELRDDLAVDDVLAGGPGVLSDGRPHVLGVDVHEVCESHVHGAARSVRVVEFERLGVGFLLEAALALMLALPVDVLVPELARPAPILLSNRGHRIPSFPPK